MLLPRLAGFLALATAYLTSPLLAQSPPIHVGEELRFPVDPQLGSASFGRMVNGDFTGDAIPDAALQRGGSIVYVLGVGVYSVTDALPGSFNDLAVYEVDASSGPDCLATVDASGLKLWGFDPDPFADEFGGTAWAGATHVRAADLDGDGDQDIVGVASDGVSILRLIRNASGSPAPFTAAAAFTAPAIIVDVSPAQWDGSGGAEVLLLTEAGLYVFDDGPAVTLVVSIASPDTAGGLATLERAGSNDRAAWFEFSPSTELYTLHVADSAGVEPVVSLGTILDPAGIASGKLFASGEPDLLVSHRQSAMQVLFIATTGTPTYSAYDPNAMLVPVRATLIDNYDPFPLNQHTPALTDVDGDGDSDIVYAVEDGTSPELLVSFNPVTPHDEQKVEIISAQFPLEAPVNVLEVSIDAPVFIPPNRDTLECWVFRKADLASPIDPEAVGYALVDVEGWPVTLSFAIENLTYEFDDLYFFQLRMVEADDDVILDGGPLLYAIAVNKEGQSAVEEIGNGTTVPIVAPGLQDPTYVGGVVPVPCPPNATNCPTPVEPPDPPGGGD